MSKDITELLKEKNGIELIRSRIESDTKLVHEWLMKLQTKCTHPTITTSKKYYGGGYDYLSSVHITVKCTICEKTLEAYNDPKHVGYHG